jgi:hypothetical protein
LEAARTSLASQGFVTPALVAASQVDGQNAWGRFLGQTSARSFELFHIIDVTTTQALPSSCVWCG